jgi:hypothetical protein
MLPHISFFSSLFGVDWLRAIHPSFTSVYFFLIPAVLLVFMGRAVSLCRFSGRKWLVFLQENSVEVLITLLIFYVTLASALLEYGENCRFKFSIESILLVYCIGIVCLPFRRTPGRKRKGNEA